ncbi:MAG: pitrilysin family protein [Muribaculaceae bacterium]
MSSKYFTHILPNGLRIVHCPTNSKVAYCGIAVNTGSRDEEEGRYGLAHFVEHTIFKGTSHRRAWHILNRMELVGGELNAYTSKEETQLYSIFPAEHYNRAIELIGDLIANSVFPEVELTKEREVVIDEINSYLDNPSEAIYDDFEDKMFCGSKLGHNILGTESDLANMSSEDCRNYLDRLYVPSNMAFYSMGDIAPEKLVRMVERHLGGLKNGLNRPARIIPATVAPFNKIRHIDAHQSHTIVGAPIFGMYDNRKYALSLLNNILGGPGMNSLLNVSMRERRGYVYTVESSATMFTDCGVFAIYFGCDDCHTKPCMRIIRNQLDALSTRPFSAKALDAAKKQYLGQILVSMDNGEGSALALGKAMLFFNRVNSIEETTNCIKSITAAEIQDMATLIGASNSSTLTMA